MIRKSWFILLAGLLTLSLCSCGENIPSMQNNAQTLKKEKNVTLEIMNPKVEIAVEFEEMARVYEQENPNVKIEIITFGGGASYLDELKARFAANEGPDIFPNGGYEEAKAWKKYLEDLSDQPWVKLAYKEALEPMTMDGKIYGMPINYEGYGFIYNKDLFAKAKIDKLPGTFTELKEAVKKLQDAGITPFTAGYSEDWFFVLMLNLAFAQQADPDHYIKELNQGTKSILHNTEIQDVLNMLDLTIDYGNNQYQSIDYNTEVAMFADGKSAMLKQGNWAGPKIRELNPDLKIGFIPMSINDSQRNGLPLGISNNWAVNKTSPAEEKKEAKKFLNWMVTSEKGKSFMKDRFHFISAFRNIDTDCSEPLADDLIRYREQGKTLTWNWFKFPGGVREEFGYVMQAYVYGQITREQLLHELQSSWDKYVKKQKKDGTSI